MTSSLSQNEDRCVGREQAQHPQQSLLIVIVTHDENLTNLGKMLVFRKASLSSQLLPIPFHRICLFVSLLIILLTRLVATGLLITG